MNPKEEKWANGNPITNTKGGRQKGQKRKEGKGGTEAVKFACLEMGECDPSMGEIPENEVNVATRKINLPNALGVSDCGRKNWAGECASIIDTGFNGCGLRIYSWLRRYAEYLRSFYHKSNLAKTDEKELRLAFWNHRVRVSDSSTALPIWANGSVMPLRTRLITGGGGITFTHGYRKET